MKIYTKTGDKGRTSLFGGKRVSKNHPRVSAYGTVDELNSLLGIVISKLDEGKIKFLINQIQEDLFLIGSYLSGAETTIDYFPKRVKEIEDIIDNLDEKMPELKNFIFPQGTEQSVFIFYVRSVARRAEREIIQLSQKEKVDDRIIIYFNRLSDLLFVFARFLNHKARIKEKIWKKPLQ